MKKSLLYGLIVLFSFAWNSCVEIEKYDNTPRGNFDALWKIMDEHYCFFEYKEVDWNAIYKEYSARIGSSMDREALFSLLCEMLAELKDGHVNLFSSFDTGRYWNWFEDYPSNYNDDLITTYLGKDYRISSGMKYKILEDNVGYIRYADFSSGIGETNLDYVIEYLSLCSGIIIDVRENGGGLLSNSDLLASRFIQEKTLIGYVQHKTGKGHSDFSKPTPKYLEPSFRLRYSKPVVVLTNRHCYSATNDFVNAMTYCPNVTVLGDNTGGGSGLPFHSELPNGWGVRFSACPMFNADMEHLEFGIEPDVRVSLLPDDVANGEDTLIEAARRILRK